MASDQAAPRRSCAKPTAANPAADELREAALGALQESQLAPAQQPIDGAAELTPGSKTKAAYKLATKEGAGGATLQAAYDTAMESYGTAPSLASISRCKAPGESPPPKGKKAPMGKDAEMFLARAVKACAARKIPLFKEGIMAGAKAIVAAHSYMQSHFGKDGPGERWYYRWLRAYDLEGAHIRLTFDRII